MDDLVNLITEQEEEVAKYGLKATIWDWRSDSSCEAKKIIKSLLADLTPIARKLDISSYLSPINEILTDGNEATQFLNMYKKTSSISQTIKHFTRKFTFMDYKLHKMIKK